MGKRTYIRADDDVRELISSVMAQFHVDLFNAEVKIEAMLVLGPRTKHGTITGPAISASGYPAAGSIRITKLEERVAGRGDAVMHLDGDRWKDRKHERHVALIDHELTHLELTRNKEGAPDRDDHQRPILKIKLHDFHVGWFDQVARRHGEASFEVEQAQSLIGKGQMYFPGFEFLKRRKAAR